MVPNRPKRWEWATLGMVFSLLSPCCLAQDISTPPPALMPAARQHVKFVDGTAYKYTSKLKQVVELNFTLGYDHAYGKPVITQALKRIGLAYGFSIVSYVGGFDGTTKGEIPNYTLDKLLSGEVIVANNISDFGNPQLDSMRRMAIQMAIEKEGRGYLGFHASGEVYSNSWTWFSDTLFPLQYQGKNDRIMIPLYKHLEEKNHIVLESSLDNNIILAHVPNELNALGEEIVSENIPIRMIKNEVHRYGRDISREPAYMGRVTVLLKFDARNTGSNYSTNFRRKGGNIYSFLYQVGHGMTSYIPAGHANDEVMSSATGFDGGVGDFDRYVAQTLFFLAGYTHQPCDSTCLGLPLVDDKNHALGAAYTGSTGLMQSRQSWIFPHSAKPEFASLPGQAYQAQLVDIAGQVIEHKSGQGKTQVRFDTSGLKPGIYFLRVKIGDRPLQSRRYVLTRG